MNMKILGVGNLWAETNQGEMCAFNIAQLLLVSATM